MNDIVGALDAVQSFDRIYLQKESDWSASRAKIDCDIVNEIGAIKEEWRNDEIKRTKRGVAEERER